MGNNQSTWDDQLPIGYGQLRRKPSVRESIGTNTGGDTVIREIVAKPGTIEPRPTMLQHMHAGRKSIGINTERSVLRNRGNHTPQDGGVGNTVTHSVSPRGVLIVQDQKPDNVTSQKPTQTQHITRHTASNEENATHINRATNNITLQKQSDVINTENTRTKHSDVSHHAVSHTQVKEDEKGRVHLVQTTETVTNDKDICRADHALQSDSSPTVERGPVTHITEEPVNNNYVQMAEIKFHEQVWNSRIQKLEDEKLKLEFENKALRTMVDDFSSGHSLPQRNSTKLRESRRELTKSDPTEVIRRYRDLTTECDNAKQQLDRLAPIGRGTHAEVLYHKFICDVLVVAFERTGEAVQTFEDNLTTMLLNAIRPTKDKYTDAGALKRRGVALYSSVIEPDPEVKAAFKSTGASALNYVLELSARCPVDNMIKEINEELKQKWPSIFTAAVSSNKDIKRYTERCCRLGIQMIALQPPLQILHNDKIFVTDRHEPIEATSMASLKKASVDFFIWPTLVDIKGNVLIKGKVKLQ
ncbi:uncharacterized protein LOC100373459 [Saccoglossus kowalevskii]|uniref:Mitochondria-eating protein n=1 Tax=Saccoglossus kowalevskii TaxID=10224 RepID=A0ABM0GJJ2_SACKO|nr:PREDICTED: uncharacterized protein LOC100373459 [Saccoglossus kowalevskii]